ncbi:MAG TPA: aromatic ring-hydroxylating dioxygenase subunit alpha [Chthoniobacterales bacterium]|nr:aromatic ring-hydroxylating dioxygenase subunit alpha [Chthoniobacterales bacterium]
MAAKVIHAFQKTADAFSQGAKTLPQKYFVSRQLFDEEQEKIFARHWVLVGHHTEIAQAGDYFVREVLPSPKGYGTTSAGESIVVVRDKSGEVRGFYNVCRHRGTRLCEEASGHSPAIQCPYHAWTYGLDGRLVGSPHMDEVPGFDRSDYSLYPVKVGIWEGFIFVNLADDAKPLEEWLAPLHGKFSHWNLAKLRSAKRVEYDVRANWKLMFENYAECYHCPGVHPQLQKVSPYDSAENDLREGPFLGGFMKINAGRSLTMSGNACAAFVGKIENLQQVFYYSIFPNMLLSLHPEYVMVHQLWPQSPERTLIICDWLFHPDAFEVRGGQPEFNPEDAIEFWDVTNKQDWHVCELSQQGIASRAYEPGPYSSRESIPAAWDREYLRQMSQVNDE